MPDGEMVFDTTGPLYLTATGHEHLLAERYGGRCYLPDEVRVEIQRGEVAHGCNCARLLEASWWKPLAITEPEDQSLFYNLLGRWGKTERNRGEAAAIVLARRHKCTAIVDDLQGRRAAGTLGVQIVGTVGILARITATGRLEEAAAWRIHQEMVEIGFRSPLTEFESFQLLVARLREI